MSDRLAAVIFFPSQQCDSSLLIAIDFLEDVVVGSVVHRLPEWSYKSRCIP